MESQKRNALVDLWRFLGMLIIMGHHQYRLGISDYPLANGWIFVEFYFILTGYLTTAHFDRSSVQGLESMAQNAVSYTLRKFLPLMPFAWAAMLIEYGFQFVTEYLMAGKGISEIASFLCDLPFEMLLVNSTYMDPHLTPVWFLSAMFLVFPLFCLLLQAAGRHTLLIVSSVIPLLFYSIFGVFQYWHFPLHLLRAISAMLLGTLAFEANQLLLPRVYERLSRRWLTAVHLVCLLLPVFACWRSIGYLLRPTLFCFVFGTAVTLSGASPLAFKNKWMVYLGKISMPLYLFHWSVAGILSVIPSGISKGALIFLYYALSVLAAIISYEAITRVRNHLSRKLP